MTAKLGTFDCAKPRVFLFALLATVRTGGFRRGRFRESRMAPTGRQLPLNSARLDRPKCVVNIRSHELLGRCLLPLSCKQSAESRGHEYVKYA